MDFIREIRTYKDDFPVWSSAYRNMGFAPHWHNEIEILYVREGCCDVVVDNKTYSLGTGDLILYGSRSPHYSHYAQKNPNQLEFVLIDPQLLAHTHIAVFETMHIPAKMLQDNGLQTMVEDWLDTVRTELSERRPYYQELVQIAFSKFWYTLQRKLPQKEENPSRQTTSKKLEKALQYIHKHYSEELPLETVASHIEISPTYFSGLFRKQVGVTYIQYLQTFRINKAMRELAKGEKRILDVAFDAGFSNIRSFNRVFQQHTGMTPSQFLKQPDKERFYVKLNLEASSTDWLVEEDSLVVQDTVSAVE